MTNDEAAPVPCRSQSPQEFVILLRQLKAWAGLTYRQIEMKTRRGAARLPISTLGAVLARDALPREEFVGSFVRACGHDPAPWIRARRRLAMAEIGAMPVNPLSRAEDDEDSPAPGPQRRLLPPAEELQGREADLRRLAAMVTPSSVTVITGPAGVGKSAVAVRLAHAVADRFVDGQIYLSLRGADHVMPPLTDLDVIRRVAASVAAPAADLTDDVAEAAIRLHVALADRRFLIVLDDVATTEQIRRLVPLGKGNALILTSRCNLTALGPCGNHRLESLTPAGAQAMLAQLVGHDRVEAEPAAARAVAGFCDHLPLALRIAAARLGARPNWPIQVLADRLSDEDRRLDELRMDHLDLRASLAVSLRTVDADPDGVTARTFRLLGGLPDVDVDVETVVRRLDVAAQQAWDALEQLVDAQVVESSVPGRYRMPTLIRLLACDARQGGSATAPHPRATRRSGEYRRPLTLSPR